MYYYYISSRWLLSKDKHAEVERIYRKMARMNGLQVSDEAINMFKQLNFADKVCHTFPYFILVKSHISVIVVLSEMQMKT